MLGGACEKVTSDLGLVGGFCRVAPYSVFLHWLVTALLQYGKKVSKNLNSLFQIASAGFAIALFRSLIFFFFANLKTSII